MKSPDQEAELLGIVLASLQVLLHSSPCRLTVRLRPGGYVRLSNACMLTAACTVRSGHSGFSIFRGLGHHGLPIFLELLQHCACHTISRDFQDPRSQ